MILTSSADSKTVAKVRDFLSRRPGLRGYLLLSPTLTIVGTLMLIPVLGMAIMSFWQQTGHMAFDVSGTLHNYVEALTRDMYRVLFLRLSLIHI